LPIQRGCQIYSGVAQTPRARQNKKGLVYIMIIRTLATVATAAWLCIAGPAAAFHFSPSTPPAIVATGAITLVQGSNTITCNAKWKFHVVSGNQDIKMFAATYTGAAACASVSTTGLPSVGKSPNLSSFDLILTMNSPFGTCGGFQNFAVAGGVISFSNSFTSPPCTFSGSLTTAPTLSITP
jgi:hypothetical protein